MRRCSSRMDSRASCSRKSTAVHGAEGQGPVRGSRDVKPVADIQGILGAWVWVCEPV